MDARNFSPHENFRKQMICSLLYLCLFTVLHTGCMLYAYNAEKRLFLQIYIQTKLLDCKLNYKSICCSMLK